MLFTFCHKRGAILISEVKGIAPGDLDSSLYFIQSGISLIGLPYPNSQVALVVKKPPASAGDIRDVGSIPGLGRSPGGGHGIPFQYSCVENPMDRRGWGLQSAGPHRVGVTEGT